MKRYILILLAIAGVAVAQPVPSAPEPLHIKVTATTDGTIQVVTQPRTLIVATDYEGFAGPNGRCLVVAAPFTRIADCVFKAGGDDAIGITGDSHGTVVVNCEAMASNWADSKALICYTASASNVVGPAYGSGVGFAGQFIGCRFQGSHFAGRIRDGVWNFIDCDIWISALSGLDVIDPCRANFIGCRFRTIPKPAEAGYWGTGKPIRVYRISGDKYLQTSLKSRLFFKGNTLDGVAIDGPGLCPGTPSYVFRSTPN